MKKIISLLMVLCCFISASSFSAYAKTDEEILFRKIPWGSTMSETEDLLSDLDAEVGGCYYMAYRDPFGIMTNDYEREGKLNTGAYEKLINISGEVAGRKLDNIELYYVFKDIKTESTALYMAIYDFGFLKRIEMEKIIDSITALYGNFDTTEKYDGRGYITYNIGTINGKNNTSINTIVYGSDDYYNVRIAYIDGNGAELAKKNLEELKRNIPINNNGL